MTQKARLQLIFSMVVFSTVGIFRKYIPISSGMLAMLRGFIGALFLILLMKIRHQKPDLGAIRKNLFLLILSGIFIGFNWILLFESYEYTTVATATLCYYMAPIFVILVSPVLFKEKLTPVKWICVLVALCGIVLISGVLETGLSGVQDLKGILCGIGAALFYGTVICLNKYIKGVPAYDKTIVQLSSAAVILVPYIFLAEATPFAGFTPPVILLVAVVGIVHTGFTYALYFGAMEHLDAQSVALISYADPVLAIVWSALILKDHVGLTGFLGAVLILGSTLVSELSAAKKN